MLWKDPACFYPSEMIPKGHLKERRLGEALIRYWLSNFLTNVGIMWHHKGRSRKTCGLSIGGLDDAILVPHCLYSWSAKALIRASKLPLLEAHCGPNIEGHNCVGHDLKGIIHCKSELMTYVCFNIYGD